MICFWRSLFLHLPYYFFVLFNLTTVLLLEPHLMQTIYVTFDLYVMYIKICIWCIINFTRYSYYTFIWRWWRWWRLRAMPTTCLLTDWLLMVARLFYLVLYKVVYERSNNTQHNAKKCSSEKCLNRNRWTQNIGIHLFWVY